MLNSGNLLEVDVVSLSEVGALGIHDTRKETVMNTKMRWVILLMVGALLVACTTPGGNAADNNGSEGGTAGEAQKASPVVSGPQTEVAPPPLVMVDADLVLRDEHNSQVFRVKSGQTIAIVLAIQASWELSYDSEALELISPEEDASNPGPTGWLFLALEPGETVIDLRTKSPACPSGEGCPEIPVDIFVVTLIVE